MSEVDSLKLSPILDIPRDNRLYRSRSANSPSTKLAVEHLKLEHKLAIEELEQKTNWSSCLSPTGHTDSRLLKFIAKFVFSATALAFCFYGVLTSHDCDPLIPFYTSLIGGIVGSYVNLPDKKK